MSERERERERERETERQREREREERCRDLTYWYILLEVFNWCLK